MIQRKQTLYLLAAIIMTVICLCMQIGSFKLGGIPVAKVYNLWYTDPIGKHHFDTWPLMAVLLPTTAIAAYTIFIYNNRKMQALFCLFNVLFIIGWYVVFFVVGQMVGDKSWGAVVFRPSWPAVFPAISLILRGDMRMIETLPAMDSDTSSMRRYIWLPVRMYMPS